MLGCAATHLRLTEDLQTVLTDELQQLAVRQAEELLFFGYLGYADTWVHKSSVAETENEDGNKKKGLGFDAPHLAEVRVDVLSTPGVQLAAADLLGKAGDANDVGGLHVFGEKVAARLGHVVNLVP